MATIDPTAAPDPPRENVPIGQLTAGNVPLDRYFTVDELLQMPEEALEELFMAIPERSFYQQALDDALTATHDTANVDDLERLSTILEMLDHYRSPSPIIPSYVADDKTITWVEASDAILDHVREGALLGAAPKTETKRPPIPVLIGIGAGVVGLFCIIFSILSSILATPDISDADTTATALALSTTPIATPTPTPIALEDIDRSIRSGDNLNGTYPTMLEIIPSDGPSRVLPVQQREVDYADWLFEDDPAIGTAVAGLIIRPVLGIPYSPSNLTFLESVTEGDAIRLGLSNGINLPFTVTNSYRIPRQDTTIFDQTTPGIVIVLLADAQNPDRLVIEGAYAPSASDAPDAEVRSIIDPDCPGDLSDTTSLTIHDAVLSSGAATETLPTGWTYLLIDAVITTTEPIPAHSLHLTLVAGDGVEHTPIAIPSAIAPSTPLTAATTIPSTPFATTIGFLIPSNAAHNAVLRAQLGDVAPLTFTLPSHTSTRDATHLDVIILDTHTEGAGSGELVVDIRFFNPTSERITVRPGDIQAIFSPTGAAEQFPVGPSTPPTADLPITIAPNEVAELPCRFRWSGESIIGLTVGGYRYVMQLR